jgi:hypothetical protein
LVNASEASAGAREVLSLFTRRHLAAFANTTPSTSIPLPGAMRCNLCPVSARAHAAPATPVILGGIVEKQVAALVCTSSNQSWVCITEEISGGLGQRSQQSQRVSHF